MSPACRSTHLLYLEATVDLSGLEDGQQIRAYLMVWRLRTYLPAASITTLGCLLYLTLALFSPGFDYTSMAARSLILRSSVVPSPLFDQLSYGKVVSNAGYGDNK